MSWSDRQVRMLQAMGLRLWVPASAEAAADLEVEAAPGPPARSAPAGPTVAVPRTAPVPGPVLEPEPSSAAAAVSADLGASATRARRDTHATDAMDWVQLRQAVAGCQACGLSESRSQTVFGTGHLQAHWLIVGEAPGAEEDRLGEPFVGASGQLLDTMLQTLGLSRDVEGDPAQRVYIANTLKCRPPSNRNPQPQEMQQCAPFLQRQIDLLQPRIILAMGRFAAQALLRNDAPLGQLRGQVHRLGGRPVVVTYHPSYLLRSPGEKAKAWADLCLAAATLEAAAG